MKLDVKFFFDKQTATFTYIVFDASTKKAAVIDSVLNYDQFSGKSNTSSADEIITYINHNHLTLEWILETHLHADHLTAAHYIREQLGGKIGIGSRIKDALNLWVPLFNTAHDTPVDASQFDVLFEDNASFKIGDLNVTVLHTPGHTPTCSCYLIEDAIFVGDTIFMPDVGTARTDFPGGSASALYDSIQRILSLPDETRIFTCHDYPPEGREVGCLSTVKTQKESNILINKTVSKEQYVAARNKRDIGKEVPKLLFPSLQVNLRAGTFGKAENNGRQYIKIPVNNG